MAGLRREDRFHANLGQCIQWSKKRLMPFVAIPWQGLRFIDRPVGPSNLTPVTNQFPSISIMDDTQYPIVRGAVQLPAGSEIITDVDEEVTSFYSLEMSNFVN
jgi:hypothetical protein